MTKEALMLDLYSQKFWFKAAKLVSWITTGVDWDRILSLNVVVTLMGLKTVELYWWVLTGTPSRTLLIWQIGAYQALVNIMYDAVFSIF